jgi:hypothetical protein
MTDRADYKFTVKEYGDGTPWLMLEPMTGDLPVLGGGHLGLDLESGVTIQDAQEVARFLNERVRAVHFTHKR